MSQSEQRQPEQKENETPLDVSLIERYVSYPATLDEGLRWRVEEQIARDPLAQEAVEFFRDYYEELDASAEPPSPEVEAFLKNLKSRARRRREAE